MTTRKTLQKMSVKPLDFDSFGVRSMATYVETREGGSFSLDAVFVVDPILTYFPFETNESAPIVHAKSISDLTHQNIGEAAQLFVEQVRRENSWN